MSTSAEGGAAGSGAPRAVVLGTVAAVVSLLAAIAFPFAPIAREEVTYTWRALSGSSATAIPMLPYQPVRTTAYATCPVLATSTGTVLSTTAPVRDPRAEPLTGLQLTSDGRGLTPTVSVESGGTLVGAVRLPPDCLALEVRSGTDATVVVLQDARTGVGPDDGVEVARVDGDVRPAVAGAFTPQPRPTGGLGLEVVGDTRFQTSIGALKIALGVVAALGLVVVLAVLARLDRRRRGPPATAGDEAQRSSTRVIPTRPRARGRVGRLVDAAVVAGLAVWQVVGPMTVDDGYIAGIVRSRFANGQVGTVFRWLNSPETPFGWFYDVLAAIAALDPAPFWLRLPSTVLGVVAWLLLTRTVLPRLRLPMTPRAQVLAGLVFLAWWLPFDLGVRPEPWVVVGWTVVLVAVERAVARRALLPLALALLVAGLTLAVTPTGLVAFTPFLAALVPLARLVRARRADAGLPLLTLGGAAALGATLLPVFLDQTWASALASVDVRRLIGGDSPWTDEYVRYAALLTAGDVEGALGRRAPVLLLLLALVALALPWVRDGLRGVARGPARRVVGGTVAALAVLALTPTKWTHHFGAFAVVGTAVTLLALHAWTGATGTDGRAGSAAPRRAAVATAVAAGVGGLVLAGYNQWHWLSGYFLTWSTLAPQLGGVRLADAVLVLGAVVALAAAVVAVRCRLDPARADPRRGRRLLAVPPLLVLAVVALVVAIEAGSFVRTSVARRDSYTLAADSLASLTGRSCGVADRLRVEPDPRRGLLAPTAPPAGSAAGSAPTPGGPADAPLSAAGAVLPGWRGPGVTGGWYALPTPDSATLPPGAGPDPDERLPLVLVVTGPELEPGRVALEVADGATGAVTRMPLDETSTQYSDSARVAAPGARDLRIERDALPAAGAVRVVTGADTPVEQGVGVPRTPRTVPWSQLLPPGAPAAVDWPAAFLFPCTPIAPLRDGLAALPSWRVSVDLRNQESSGYISYTASQGGPWASARTLVREERLPVYLPGLPTTDVASLVRWIPVVPLGAGPEVRRERVVEPGTSSPGPLTVGRG